MVSRVFSVAFLLFFTVCVDIAIADLVEIDCDDLTKSQVESFIGSEMGVSDVEIHERLIVADMMSDRCFTKTWATTLNLAGYEAVPFGPGIVKENMHRFSYPQGEASGGYRNTRVPERDPFRTWELHAREVMQFTYDYMLQLSSQIEGFGDLFPVKPILDGGCEQRFHATHAEVKLLTRLMRQGSIPEEGNVIMSVSRHMCEYCRVIVAYLARNGRRKIAVIAPRKKSKGSKTSIDQPEYILFQADGSFTRYTRKTASGDSPYECKNTMFTGNIPGGIDTYHPPDPNFNPPERQINQWTAKLTQALNKSVEVARRGLVTNANFSVSRINPDPGQLREPAESCENVIEGPGTECITYVGTDLPSTIDCPRPDTMTGIHGSFGPLKPENPIIVLKSIGSFCEVSRKVPAMGSPVTPFELKCPEDHQLTGFYGRFGLLVDQIGIICRRISDGSQWKSSVAGTSSGGSLKEQECESGAAGRQIKFQLSDAIGGLGLCCR